jgi:uncharacterized membrane protein YciS (DUF1049 family)
MVRNFILPLLLFAVLLLAVVFAALNPGPITVDFGFAERQMQKSLALTLAFGAGWLAGMLSLGVVLLRLWHERRRLRKQLRLAEAEVRTLRSLPVEHAD